VPATFAVTTNADAGAGSLRAAIDAANVTPEADTINFDAAVAGQTITATTNDTTNPFAFGPTAFVVTSDITIVGDPGAAGVTISGNNSHRIFGVLPGGSLTLQFLTITNGKVQGGDDGSGPRATGGWRAAAAGLAWAAPCSFPRAARST
jgi:hypothetical protein